MIAEALSAGIGAVVGAGATWMFSLRGTSERKRAEQLERRIRRYCERAQAAAPARKPFTRDHLIEWGVIDETEQHEALIALDALCQKRILEYSAGSYFLRGR